MLLSQDEVRDLTKKRHASRDTLHAWFAKVDEMLSTYPTYERERPL